MRHDLYNHASTEKTLNKLTLNGVSFYYNSEEIKIELFAIHSY